MYLMCIVAGMASSTMESDSTSECLLDNVDKDKQSQEAATDAPASSTLHSHEGKSESFEAEKSGSNVEQVIEEEFQEGKVKSTDKNATDIEKESDNKSKSDFQLPKSDVDEPSSTVDIESSSDVNNKLSSKSSKWNSTEDLVVDMKHFVSDNNDSEITIDSLHEDETQTEHSSLETSNAVLSTSSKPNLVEGTAVDDKQKTTEKNEPDSLSKEEELSCMDVVGSEENSNISGTQETKSGFDSADSTNDVDSFTTQEAVHMAMKSMDEEEGGDKKKDNLSLSNTVTSSQHKESVIELQTDCSSTSKTESPRTCCRNKEFTDNDMKKVERNLLDIEITRDIACYPENICPKDKKRLDDDKHTEIDPVVAINEVEEKIENIKSATPIKKVEEIMGTLKSSGDDKVEKIETQSTLFKIKEDFLKDKTKPVEISNENLPQLKLLDKVKCEVTHLDSSKSSTPVESTSKMDTSEKDVSDKNNTEDLKANSEIIRPCGLKSNEDLQTSNRELLDIGNSCNLSRKENGNLVVKDTDSELMEVDEQMLTEEESLAPNTQSLSTAVENESLNSEIENKKDSLTKSNHITDKTVIENMPGDKNLTTENPTVSTSSESEGRKNLESEDPDLIKPDQADIADSCSTDLVAFMRSALAKNEEFRKNLSSEYKDLKEETIEECGIELICLDDDDEGVQIKRPPEAKLCVNPICMSGVDLQKPANFVLTYFKLKKAKNQLVCAECFDVVCKHQQVRQKK